MSGTAVIQAVTAVKQAGISLSSYLVPDLEQIVVRPLSVPGARLN